MELGSAPECPVNQPMLLKLAKDIERISQLLMEMLSFLEKSEINKQQRQAEIMAQLSRLNQAELQSHPEPIEKRRTVDPFDGYPEHARSPASLPDDESQSNEDNMEQLYQSCSTKSPEDGLPCPRQVEGIAPWHLVERTERPQYLLFGQEPNSKRKALNDITRETKEEKERRMKGDV